MALAGMLPSAVAAAALAVAAAAPAAAAPARDAGVGAVGAAQSAAAGAALPGRFVVQGAPLVRRGGVVAGRSVSVFARPVVVVVEGCRSRGADVRVRRGRASVSARVACARVPGLLRLRATINGGRLRGTITSGRRVRRFVARRLAVPKGGGLLRGGGSARALRSVRNVDDFARHPDSEISSAPGGLRVARTELELRFTERATVAQVNAALRSVGGRIAGSLKGSPLLAVVIPDPGGLAALDAVIAGLAARPGVARVAQSTMVHTDELPPGLGSPPSASGALALSHLLAMRMPAAWNARRAIQSAKQPTLIVMDLFGNGPLSSHVDADIVPGAAPLVAGPTFDPKELAQGRRVKITHGYHVVGAAAASFANNGTRAGLVTGVFPARARLLPIDLVAQTGIASFQRLLQAASAQTGPVVVNTSLGWESVTDAEAREGGSFWARDVRRLGLEDRMVHAASAGNDAIDAKNNNRWTAATLRADLTAADGTVLPKLSNTLVVENLQDTGPPRFEPSCLGVTSNRTGNIAAVGEDVFSHLTGTGAGNKSGTSMAAPQVAALAEYVWSIAPDLKAPQVTALLIATAQPALPIGPGACPTTLSSSRRLDAYAAVLSTDQAAAVTPEGAPVRLAMLNRDGDAKFDEADIAAHAAALHAPGAGNARDWSRSDLNGDGLTVAEVTSAPFDLDPRSGTRGAAPRIDNPVEQNIRGTSVRFDETRVTDLEALCYYTYSDLYRGSPTGRETLLTSDLRGCGHPLQVTPTSSTVTPGGTVQLTAKVLGVTDSTVGWAASAGSVSATGLYTAPTTPGSYVVAAADVSDPARRATAAVNVLDPGLSGKFNGTSTLCETRPIDVCFPTVNAKALLQAGPDEFTIYMRSADQGWGSSYPTASCNDPPFPTCEKFGGTRSGLSYNGVQVGTGVDPSFTQTFRATLNGDVLSGRVDEPVGGNGDFRTFTITHDPD